MANETTPFAGGVMQLRGMLWPMTYDAVVSMEKRLRCLPQGNPPVLDCGMELHNMKAATSTPGQRVGNVAVLSIRGVISHRLDWLSYIFGGTSTEQLGRAFDALVADKSVDAILLDIDSPGGNYAGTPELATKIYEARGKKKCWAIANSMAASAAYWIATAAEKVFCIPSGDVGSVGVVAVHYDMSAMNEQEGVKPTYITYGDYKAEFNPDGPLTDDAIQELQRRVNEAGETFVKAVSKQRGTTPSDVRANYGKGRCLSAADAKAAGMIDGIATIDEVIEKMTGRGSGRGPRASIERHRLDLMKTQ